MLTNTPAVMEEPYTEVYEYTAAHTQFSRPGRPFHQRRVLVRMRKLFRGAAPTHIPPAAQTYLTRTCDIRSIIDLRTTFEHNGDPDPEMDGVAVTHLPLIPMKTLGITFEDGNLGEMLRGRWNPDTLDICSVYRDMVDESVADAWRDIFRILLESEGHAVMWHCTNGKDRTGVVAAVILLALGVPMDQVMADYLATNAQLKERRRSILDEAAARGGQPGLAAKLGPLLEARPEYLNATLMPSTSSMAASEAFWKTYAN